MKKAYYNLSGICVCDNSCKSGDSCELTCNSHGVCQNDTCICGDGSGHNAEGYWGPQCLEKACPGRGSSCSGHGRCVQERCTCDPGWALDPVSCHIPDCPGTPNCNNNGVCGSEGDQPKCTCNPGWMGNACQYPCVHGTPHSDGTCHCDDCYTGPACDQICNDKGACVNRTCQCNSGYWGKVVYYNVALY